MGNHYLAFSKQWFEKHQKILLFLLNKPFFKYFFRYILRIHKDVLWSEKIVEIQPNNYKVLVRQYWEKGEKRLKIRADFRTHAKFSKRIYYSFKPIWWIAHYIDEWFLDKYFPDYSFGFDTLTVYPDAGTGGTTVDGFTRPSFTSLSFSAIRAAAGSVASATTTSGNAVVLGATTTTDEYDILHRGIFLFDTSSISSTSSINTATFSLYITATATALGDTTVDVVSSNPASDNNLVAADHGTLGTTVYGDMSISSATTSAYNDMVLNSDGRSAISKSGISKYGTRTGWDTDNSFGGSWSSNQSTSITNSFADNTGTSQDPKLVVVFTPQKNVPIYFFS